MAEENKTNVTENNVNATENKDTQKKEEKKKEEVKFDITTKPLIFGGICSDKYIRSDRFAKLVHEVFKKTYADAYGATFDMIPGTNRFMISLYFDHDIHDGDILPCALTKIAENEQTKNATLNSIRKLQNRNTEGDKYHLTDEGKAGIKKFLFDQRSISKIYKSSGFNKVDVNWKEVTAEVYDPVYGSNFPKQLTKVSFLDCDKLAALLWGNKENLDPEAKDADDASEYGVSAIKSFPNVYGGVSSNTDYLLQIKRISRKNLIDLCQSFGLGGIQHGLNIIR